MSRAKMGDDPRTCPGCGRKMLYRRAEPLGTRVDPVDVGCMVHVDRCNGCWGIFHDGRTIHERGKARTLANVEAERAALLAHAAREDALAEAARAEAERARAFAAALFAALT